MGAFSLVSRLGNQQSQHVSAVFRVADWQGAGWLPGCETETQSHHCECREFAEDMQSSSDEYWREFGK